MICLGLKKSWLISPFSPHIPAGLNLLRIILTQASLSSVLRPACVGAGAGAAPAVRRAAALSGAEAAAPLPTGAWHPHLYFGGHRELPEQLGQRR